VDLVFDHVSEKGLNAYLNLQLVEYWIRSEGANWEFNNRVKV
jgi:hypothetical protein